MRVARPHGWQCHVPGRIAGMEGGQRTDQRDGKRNMRQAGQFGQAATEEFLRAIGKESSKAGGTAARGYTAGQETGASVEGGGAARPARRRERARGGAVGGRGRGGAARPSAD